MTTPPLPPPPSNRRGPRIAALKNQAAQYEALVRRQVLDPFVRQIETRVRAAGNNYAAIRQAIEDVPQSPTLAGLSDSAATSEMQRLRRWHRDRFTRLMSRALGVNIGPFSPELQLRPLMTAAIRRNADLISTIPPRYHASLKQKLIQLADSAPFDEQELARVLQNNYQSSGYNLRRLTRDQTSKLVGELNQARQEQVGITAYIWSTSGDGRVRPTHRDNDGLTFLWSSPPPTTGHPGHDVQCRCVALAVLPNPRRRWTPRSTP